MLPRQPTTTKCKDETLRAESGSARRPAPPQGFDGRTAGAGAIAIGHDVDRNISLFAALGGHAGPDLAQEPVPELVPRLDRPAADDERVGVEHIDHLVEEEPERVGLDLKDPPTQRIAAFGKTADPLGGLVRRRASVKLVVRVARQKVRQQRAFDRRQRTQRLEIARPETVALRPQPSMPAMDWYGTST